MRLMTLAGALVAAPLTAQVTPPVTAGTAHATVAAPAGWSTSRALAHVRFDAPEGDLFIDLVDVDGVLHAAVRTAGKALRDDMAGAAKEIAVSPAPAAVARLAAAYRNHTLGRLKVRRVGRDVIFRVAATRSRIGTREYPDGSHGFVMIDPATSLWELLARPAGRYDSLVIRQGEREYAFTPIRRSGNFVPIARSASQRRASCAITAAPMGRTTTAATRR